MPSAPERPPRTRFDLRHLLRRLAATLERWVKAWSWLNLNIAAALQERLRRRLTVAGQGVLAVAFTAGLFGVDTRQTLAHQVFALGVTLLVVALAARGRVPPGLRARRLLPRHGTVGVPCTYCVEVTNTGRRPARGLSLGERLTDPRPPLPVFLAARAPFEHQLNPLERLFGYPRWEWLLRERRRVDRPQPVALPDLAPGETVALTLTLTPTRRGPVRLPTLVAIRRDPLGLVRREVPVMTLTGPTDPDRLLILPRRWPMGPQPAVGRRRHQPGGVNPAGRLGQSREFVGLRDYLPGDSPRHIHWPAWARCGKPVVKEYQDEYFSRQALVLDTCADPSDQAKDGDPGRLAGRLAAFECAVSVAASLLEPLLRAPGAQDGLLDLLFVAGEAHCVTAGRGLAGQDGLLEVLAGLEPQPASRFAALAALVVGRVAQLSACLCVLLDWDAPRQALVAALAARGLEVRVLVCTTEAVRDPPGAAPTALVRVDPADPAPALATF